MYYLRAEGLLAAVVLRAGSTRERAGEAELLIGHVPGVGNPRRIERFC